MQPVAHPCQSVFIRGSTALLSWLRSLVDTLFWSKHIFLFFRTFNLKLE